MKRKYSDNGNNDNNGNDNNDNNDNNNGDVKRSRIELVDDDTFKELLDKVTNESFFTKVYDFITIKIFNLCIVSG